MKISIQTGTLFPELGVETSCRLFREAGFEALDWDLCDDCPTNRLIAGERSGISILEKTLPEMLAFYADTLAAIRKEGLTLAQAHGPFPPYREQCPELMDYVIETTRNAILLCDAVGCPNLVVHGVSIKKDWSITADDVRELNRRLYTSLIPTLRRTNVTVCLENLTSSYPGSYTAGICSDPGEAIGMIDSLNAEAGRDCFGLCFDTGHYHMIHGDMRAYLLRLGKRVRALHIHDNRGASDDHLAPYTGTIVWKDLYESLRTIGYAGDLSFETFRQTCLSRLEPEMVAPWLRLIADTGKFFRDRINAG